ncbi:hypothetical protein AAFF_G00356660, partial [Aldrovandia affinis]
MLGLQPQPQWPTWTLGRLFSFMLNDGIPPLSTLCGCRTRRMAILSCAYLPLTLCHILSTIPPI